MESVIKSHICKVDASAGSGKTYALAKRYLSLLFHSLMQDESEHCLQSILAITFTNKAAVEMKHRILGLLKKIAFKQYNHEAEKKDLLDLLKVDETTASDKAIMLIDEILTRYDFFQVKTIDSFINAILMGCAFQVGRTGRFSVTHEYVDYLSYSFDDLLEEAGHDSGAVAMFSEFLKHYLYTHANAAWVPRSDMFVQLDQIYQIANTYGVFIQKNVVSGDMVRTLRSKIVGLMGDLHAMLPEGTKKTFEKKLTQFVTHIGESFSLSDFSKSLESPEFPVKKNYEVPVVVQNVWDELRKTITQMCEVEALFQFNPFVEMYQKVFSYLSRRMLADDIVFLSDLNREVRVLFEQGGVSVPELYYRLAARYRHYLIDEFQDTSRLQWSNLQSLVSEALATGGSLYYVGDKKQSIYQFRGGDPRLFDAIPSFFAAFPTTVESLATNYRSQKEIVCFVNGVFSQENLLSFLNNGEIDEDDGVMQFSEKDKEEIVSVFAGSEQRVHPDKKQGYVRHLSVCGNTSAEIRDEVYASLRDIIDDAGKRQYAFSDIAVLVRSNRDVEELTARFLADAIPVVSEKTLSLKSNRVILELVAFLTFLDSPIDNLSFAVFIQGEIFLRASGMSRADVEAVLFSVQFLQRKQGAFIPFYTVFREHYPGVWQTFIEDFFKKVGISPLYEFVQQIIATYNVHTFFPEAHAFIMRFLEFVREEEEQHVCLNSLLKYFNALDADDRSMYVHVSQEKDAVSILTTHKSKGLEFPIVIVPAVSLNCKVNNYALIRDTEKERDVLRIVAVKKKYGTWSNKLRKLYCDEYKRELIAELNTLYVTLTRASEELYVFVPEKIEGKKKNRVLSLFSEHSGESGAPRNTVTVKGGVSQQTVPLYPVPYEPWMEKLRREFIDPKELQRRKAILRGDILHFMLSTIGAVMEETVHEVLAHARKMVHETFPLYDDQSSVFEAIERIVSDTAMRDIFFVNDGDVFTEKELVSREGEAKRIDRLIVRADEVVIVDYKSSRDGYDEYVAQMQGYYALVQEMYPLKRVYGYLLFIDTIRLERIDPV